MPLRSMKVMAMPDNTPAIIAPASTPASRATSQPSATPSSTEWAMASPINA